MAECYACHVFAHSEGRYQTVHSVGVAPDEARELEQFFFGQTADPKYLESLCDEPGVIWRRIGSRISLTRVSRGKPDADNRSTLRFETLLADSSNAALRSQVAELCKGEWRFSVDGMTVTARQPTPSGPVNASRISEIALAAREGSRVIAPAAELTLDDAAKIIQHAADIQGFSLCYKSLNKQAPVSVNIVAMAVSETIKVKSKRNPAPMSRQPSRPPAQRAGPQSGTTLMLAVILVAFVVQTVVLWTVASASSGESQLSKMQEHIITRIEAESERQSEKIDAVARAFQERFDEQRSENSKRFDEQRSENSKRFDEQDAERKRDAKEMENRMNKQDAENSKRFDEQDAERKRDAKEIENRMNKQDAQAVRRDQETNATLAKLVEEVRSRPANAPSEGDTSENGTGSSRKKNSE